jgi:hypothetical protein
VCMRPAEWCKPRGAVRPPRGRVLRPLPSNGVELHALGAVVLGRLPLVVGLGAVRPKHEDRFRLVEVWGPRVVFVLRSR